MAELSSMRPVWSTLTRSSRTDLAVTHLLQGRCPGNDRRRPDTAVDTAVAAVASQIALLGGGPDAVTPAGLRAIDRSLTYVKGASTRPGQVSVISASNAVGIAAMSRSGTCFWLKYSVGDGVQTFGVGRPCTGRAALGAEGDAW